MNKWANKFLAITFPWMVFFLHDRPLEGVFALLMQGSVIGWLPAVYWAWSFLHPNKKDEAKQDVSSKQDNHLI